MIRSTLALKRSPFQTTVLFASSSIRSQRSPFSSARFCLLFSTVTTVWPLSHISDYCSIEAQLWYPSPLFSRPNCPILAGAIAQLALDSSPRFSLQWERRYCSLDERVQQQSLLTTYTHLLGQSVDEPFEVQFGLAGLASDFEELPHEPARSGADHRLIREMSFLDESLYDGQFCGIYGSLG